MSRRVLVTGADKGIGLATVVHLAGLGFEVTGSVRSDDGAAQLAKVVTEAGVDVEPVVLELDDAEASARVVSEVRPWALVNNAGYMNVGALVDVTGEEDVRRRAVADLARWLGDPAGASELGRVRLPPLMATAAPRPRRWEVRAGALAPALFRARVTEMAERLGYGDPSTWR